MVDAHYAIPSDHAAHPDQARGESCRREPGLSQVKHGGLGSLGREPAVTGEIQIDAGAGDGDLGDAALEQPEASG